MPSILPPLTPNELTLDGVLICNHPPEITLRRGDGSHATYAFPVGPDAYTTGGLALEARIIARIEDEMASGGVIVE